jgi:F-type H+-transporting ATPase subunit epsilon
MTNGTFTFRLITPLAVVEREITYLRLYELSGHYGIMRGHADFLSVLRPSLGYYFEPKGTEVFFAAKGGVFRVVKGEAILSTRAFVENIEAGELSDEIQKRVFAMDETEAVSVKMLERMERMFLEKTLEFLR